MKKLVCLILLIQFGFSAAQTKTVVTMYGEKVQINPNSLTTANNGLTATNGNVLLGGTLTQPATTINASPTNTFAISGLQNSISGTDNLIVADPITGVLRTLNPSSLNNGWLLKGNAGTTASPISTTSNFIGTTDNAPINFRVNNIHAGWIGNDVGGYTKVSSVYLGMRAGLTAAGNQNIFNNVAIGESALTTSTGAANVAVGASALQSNTTANWNVAMGYLSMFNNTNGSNNTAIGSSSLVNNTTGINNTALGYNAGSNNTQASKNTFIGNSADLTSSGLNVTNATAIGNNAKVGQSNSIIMGGTGADAVNVGIGNTTPANTLHITPVTGLDPVRIDGLITSISTTDNIVVVDGNGVLKTRSSAPLNTNNWNILGNAGTTPGTNFIGTTDSNQLNFKVNNIPAGKIGLTGGDPYFPNTYLGYNAGAADTGTTLPSASTAFSNTAFGGNALTAITTGWYNTALGANALPVNTTGFGNTAIGPNTLTKNTIGFNNVAVGNGALLNTNATDGNNGNNNIAIGISTLRSNTTGFRNIAIGSSSLYGNTTGSYNVCIGGTGSTDVNTNNTYGTFLGYEAGANLPGTTDAMALGHSAKINANYGIAIGSNSYVLTGATNSVAIGKNAIASKSNTIILGAEIGNTSLTPVPFVGIGTNAPFNSLHVKSSPNSDPVRFEGLQQSVAPATDLVVVADANGVLKTALKTDMGDNLGNHTATKDLIMGGFNINNASNITATAKTTTQTAQITKGTDGSTPAIGSIAASTDTNGNIKWVNPAEVTGIMAVKIITTTYAPLATDNVILVNADAGSTININLSSGVAGKTYTIKRIDDNFATVNIVFTGSIDVTDNQIALGNRVTYQIINSGDGTGTFGVIGSKWHTISRF